MQLLTQCSQWPQAEKIYEEVNIKFLVEAMEREAEEYGQFHDEDCLATGASSENAWFGDKCECESVLILKQFTRGWMARVNKKWIEATKAHLPYCRPEGRRTLTPLYGGRLKSEAHKRAISEAVSKAWKHHD